MNGSSKFGGVAPRQTSLSKGTRFGSNPADIIPRVKQEYIADEEEIKQPPTHKIPGFEVNQSKMMGNTHMLEFQKRINDLEKQS